MGFGLLRAPRQALPEAGAVGRQVPWPLLIVAGWLLQLFVRLLLTRTHRMLMVMPDEPGYLMAARLLAGRPGNNLSGAILYQGGYPLLASIAYRISEDPQTAYRIILAINALIGAFLFPLAYVALRRLEVTKGKAYPLAMITGFLPSAVFHGQLAWTDAVLPVVVLGWLLCVHSWLSRGAMSWAVAASALAAYSFCLHNRGVVIVVVHAGLILVALMRDWVDKDQVLAAAGMLMGGGAAGWLLNAWIMVKLYPQGPMTVDHLVRERLTSLDGWGWTLALATGKLWYLLVATWGFAGVGLAAAGAVALRGGAPRALRASAALVLAVTAGMALATSAAIPDEDTVGNFAYGRYLACVAPVLFLAGCAFAVRGDRASLRRAILATAIAAPLCALVVWLHAGKRLSTNLFALIDFPEMSVLTWSWHDLKLGWATCAVLPGLAALFFLRHRRIGMVAMAAVIAVHGVMISVTAWRVTRHLGKSVYDATSLAPAGLTKADVVAVDVKGLHPRILLSQMVQVRSTLQGLDRQKPRSVPPTATLVVVPWDVKQPATKSWPTAPRDFSLVQSRHTAVGGWAAWRRVS